MLSKASKTKVVSYYPHQIDTDVHLVITNGSFLSDSAHFDRLFRFQVNSVPLVEFLKSPPLSQYDNWVSLLFKDYPILSAILYKSQFALEWSIAVISGLKLASAHCLVLMEVN